MLSYIKNELVKFKGNLRAFQLLKNAISSIFTKGINLLVAFLLIPIVVDVLPIEQYAIFAVIMSLSIVFSYSDFGLGLGIVNIVASKSKAVRDRYIASVFVTLLFVSLILLLVWLIVINFYLSLSADEKLVWSFFLLFSTVGISFGLVHRILLGLNKVYISNAYRTFANVLVLIVAYIAAEFDPKLITLVTIVSGIPVAVNVFLTFYVFRVQMSIGSLLTKFNYKLIPSVARIGLAFLIVQLAIYIELPVDVVLIKMFYQDLLVRDYDIITKLFLYVPALVSVALMPMWPSFRVALANQDIQWVIRVFSKMRWLVFMFSFLTSISMYFLVDEITYQWVGVEVLIAKSGILGIAIFVVLQCYSNLQSVTLNAMDLVKIQASVALVIVSLGLLLKIFTLVNFSLVIMIWSFVFLYIAKIIYFEKIMYSEFQNLNRRKAEV